jgi:hypothetical protein
MPDAQQQTHNTLGAGLCADCLYSRRIETERGSVFFLCELSVTDPRYTKYPRLPVLTCGGYKKKPYR